MSKEILRKEVRFAVHIPRTDYREDAHYIKEQVFYKDGTQEPRTYLVKDYTRPIWVEHPRTRTYTQKREFGIRETMIERQCTQSDLNKVVAGMLEIPHMAQRPNELKASPYLYGYDQTSTSIIKLKSLMGNNFIQAPYTVAGFDIETDVDTMEIKIATVVYNGKAHMAISSKYIESVRSNYRKRFDDALALYLPEYVGKIDVQITVHDHEVDMLKAVFKTANEWSPDFLAIWNINFDIKRILERLKFHGVNPVDVICDMKVPRPYRICKYKEGMTKKPMASGKVKPISPSLQWHTLTSTTTFYVIDAMCVFRQIRSAKQEEPSYDLNSILTKFLKKRGKLKFTQADKYKKEKWHRFMQTEYPIEYMVYNLYDCLGMLALDEVTKDLSNSMPSGAGMTDFAKFTSNPKRIVDAMFPFGLERGKVIGTAYKPKQKDEDEDDVVEAVEEDDEEEGEFESQDKYKGLGLKGWIQLLPQNQLTNEGLCCFEDYPNLVTNIRGMTWDVDATAAYPTCTEVGNVSKATCVNELINVDGVDVETFKEQNLSLCMGGVNSLEYFSVMFGMPTLDEIDSML